MLEWPAPTADHTFTVEFDRTITRASVEGDRVSATFRPSTLTTFGPATLALAAEGPRHETPCDQARCTWQHHRTIAFPVELRDAATAAPAPERQ